jgi:hypothetical protein
MSATVLDDATPTARKQHFCDQCLRAIEPGETYRRQRVITDDGPDVWKTCAHCQAVYGHIWAHDPDARYYDDGVDLHEYLIECDRGGPLCRAFERKWRGVSVGEIPLEVLGLVKEPTP